MKKSKAMFLVILLVSICGTERAAQANGSSAFQQPVLKWQLGGCEDIWCQTGWYSSPAVADLDGDGSMEVIGAAYSIYVLDGETGALEWKVASGHDRSEPNADDVGRTWPGVVVADVDKDAQLEIVTAHSGGYVSVYNAQGYFETGWPQRPTNYELRGLSVADLDANGDLEIIVTATGSDTNTWVFEHNGTVRAGWPQLSDDGGYAWGVYNDNAAVGDIDGDGFGELVVPSDVHYICAYEANGAHIPANPIYDGKNWGQVGIWESLETELRGWGECNGVRAESYRANFADGPAVIADMDGNGVVEVAAVGNMYDCDAGYPPSRYYAPFIFKADRSRFKNEFYDWSQNPVDTGAPISEDYDVIETAEPNPVAADLDGDGVKELLFASYDGRLHAYWLDGQEHGQWPVEVYNVYEGFYRFASEPTVADLDTDGKAEVIFTSWTQKGYDQTGLIYIVDHLGNLLYQTFLPGASAGQDWNGALPAPTLANIDGDADLEAVVNTAHSGLVAYDLPGSQAALVLWGTARGNYLRNGFIPSAAIQKEHFFIPLVGK
jgi:hypothetical protein